MIGPLTFTVGALLRGSFRRMLQRNALHFVEDKGLLDSQFVVSGSDKELRALTAYLRRIT